jgi:hypothetical protein
VPGGQAVEIRELSAFPIADPLPALLHGESSRYDQVVVAVARASPHRPWMLAELRHEGLYPEVILAVATEEERPAWAAANSPRILIATDGAELSR